MLGSVIGNSANRQFYEALYPLSTINNQIKNEVQRSTMISSERLEILKKIIFKPEFYA